MTVNVFVTVGAQMPFDRLVTAVDRWAASSTCDVDVFAQVGPTGEPPRSIEWVASLDPDEFAVRMDWADVIVSHAGMGTILSALVAGKPLVLMPRLGSRGETRNDHQVGTMARFNDRPGVLTATDETDLVAALDEGRWSRPEEISPDASPQLIEAIRDFIES